MPPSNDRLKAARRLPMQLFAATIIGSLTAGTLGWLSPYQALGFTVSLALAVALGALARRRTEAVLSAEIRRRRSAEQESRAANRAKSEFLANMSHELRTPLSAVIGITDLLLGAGLAPDQHHYVEVANNSADSLLALTDDIFDFAKLEAGRLRLDAEDFRLREQIEGVRELMAPAAAEKGVELDVEIDASVPDAVNGDPSRLRQVLLNLVGNALKFTARGRVEIRIFGEESHAGSHTCFAVRDTGIGISPKDHRRIFKTFSQADSSSARRFGGSGLGLAISKELVERMGGEIGLESARGAGSTFWFRLPLAAARGELPPPAAGAPQAATRQDFDRGRFRVLVVDDDAINRRLALAHLEALGYRAAEADAGESALCLLAAERFDAVLMDCQMPDLDGYETTRRWRRREAARPSADGRARLPVIALTAHAMAGERAKCLDVGMDDYLAKPYRGVELRAMLDHWLHPEAGAAPAAVADAAPRAPGFEERIGSLRRLGEHTGQDVLGPAIAAFPRDSGGLLGKTRRAVASGDSGVVAQSAHSLIARSGMLGAEQRLTDLLREIEAQALAGRLDGLDQLVDEAEAEIGRLCERLEAVEP